jgi:hypothetical protein
MIKIENQEQTNSTGRTLYTLKINNKIIVTFYHWPEDGLVTLLKIAAQSVAAKNPKDKED